MDAFLHEFCRHFIEMNMLNALFLSDTMSSIVAYMYVGEFVILTDVQVGRTSLWTSSDRLQRSGF